MDSRGLGPRRLWLAAFFVPPIAYPSEGTQASLARGIVPGGSSAAPGFLLQDSGGGVRGASGARGYPSPLPSRFSAWKAAGDPGRGSLEGLQAPFSPWKLLLVQSCTSDSREELACDINRELVTSRGSL